MSAHKLRALRRRLEWLDRKIATGEGSQGALTFDKAEAAALRWVLGKLVGEKRS